MKSEKIGAEARVALPNNIMVRPARARFELKWPSRVAADVACSDLQGLLLSLEILLHGGDWEKRCDTTGEYIAQVLLNHKTRPDKCDFWCRYLSDVHANPQAELPLRTVKALWTCISCGTARLLQREVSTESYLTFVSSKEFGSHGRFISLGNPPDSGWYTERRWLTVL